MPLCIVITIPVSTHDYVLSLFGKCIFCTIYCSTCSASCYYYCFSLKLVYSFFGGGVYLPRYLLLVFWIFRLEEYFYWVRSSTSSLLLPMSRERLDRTPWMTGARQRRVCNTPLCKKRSKWQAVPLIRVHETQFRRKGHMTHSSAKKGTRHADQRQLSQTSTRSSRL